MYGSTAATFPFGIMRCDGYTLFDGLCKFNQATIENIENGRRGGGREERVRLKALLFNIENLLEIEIVRFHYSQAISMESAIFACDLLI